MAANSKSNHPIAIHAVLPRSVRNGPGVRFVVWVQGCSILCKGCFNPKTLPFLKDASARYSPPNSPGWTTVGEVVGLIELEHDREPIEGVTVSGGEPFDQAESLGIFLAEMRKMNLTTVVYSGYTWEELNEQPDTVKLLKCDGLFDVVIAGPFMREFQTENDLRGSTNQEFHFLTNRYSAEDMVVPGAMEIQVRQDGSIAVTGYANPDFTGKLKSDLPLK